MRPCIVCWASQSYVVSERAQSFRAQVGVAFTRFQTRYFQGKYSNLDATVISYGPCQTPTLNFAVEQHQRMVGFEPENFWVVVPECGRAGGGGRLPVEWERGRVFSHELARYFQLEVCPSHKHFRIVVVKMYIGGSWAVLGLCWRTACDHNTPQHC